MDIVKAKKDDIDSIFAIEKENFTSDLWNKQQWESEFDSNCFANIYLLIINQEIIGYIDYWIMFEQASIAKMCVKKECTNKGYGDLLLKKALKSIDQENCILTTLEVRVSNVNAIKLYQNNKFKIKLVKKGYYSDGEDCYYMIRSIGDVYEG